MGRKLDPIPETEEKRILACYNTMTLKEVAARFKRDPKRVKEVLIKHGVTIQASAAKRWA